jgi:chromosome segregation ATPase
MSLENASFANENLNAIQSNLEQLSSEKAGLLSEISTLRSDMSGLQDTITNLNLKITNYESEIENLKSATNSSDLSLKLEQQDAYIDKLFKQIDLLSDERLNLLSEKEQMANQLLKMNDVIGEISQQVESENINVNDLNNHRKNIILANGSSKTGDTGPIKQQINDLVREIDKCIALLSA